VKRRGIVENSALALAGDVAGKAATFLLLAVAARALDGREFARLATALATATVLTAVFDCGAQVLLTRDGARGAESGRALLLALAWARCPLVVAGVIGGCLVGAIDGSIALGIATVLLAVAGAAQQSLSGILRSAQNLRPEALARLTGALATIAGGSACVLLSTGATLVVFTLACAMVASSLPMALSARRVVAAVEPVVAAVEPVAAWPALRRALPLGLMALATLAYYRSGTIVLSLLAGPHQTGLFAAASTLGFALLVLGNAVTTGLLPRLAAGTTAADRAAVTRAALAWTAAITACVAAAVIAAGRPLMILAFGSRYGGGAPALALLAAASVPIGLSGVLGTALIAAGRVRAVAIQVAATLCANLALLAVLARPLGATGAALATLGCEVLALLMLAGVTASVLPGVLPRPRAGALPLSGRPEPQR
jgi:O-antigen/teichoic acid export membrane protein